MRRALVIVFVLGCSSSPPPVVDAVSFGPFVPNVMGNPTALGEVTAHATAGATITQLDVRFDPQDQSGVTFWEGPPIDVSDAASPYGVTLAFRAGLPPATYSLEITVTDSTGSTSDPFEIDVVLH